LGYSQQRVAVERNEEIVPKALYNDTILCAGDCVEVVRFVGGG
ncbi:MAG: sulfur carrier protein ThiS, partial [Ruminococcus sp.]|nr:sulfur carrier protein ThiS [Ruminococcus sp.]